MIPATFRSISGEDVVALRLADDNLEEVAAWTDGEVIRFSKPLLSGQLDWAGVRFSTKNGAVHARIGDWVVQKEREVFPFQAYPDHIFQGLYQYI